MAFNFPEFRAIWAEGALVWFRLYVQVFAGRHGDFPDGDLLPVDAGALLEEGNEAGLLEVMVSRQRLADALLPHDNERNAVGE